MRHIPLVLAFLTSACTPSAPSPGEGEGEGEAAFALTSSAFAEGELIPDRFTCNGAKVSPPLAWVGAPQETAGFALVLTDLSNGAKAYCEAQLDE